MQNRYISKIQFSFNGSIIHQTMEIVLDTGVRATEG